MAEVMNFINDLFKGSDDLWSGGVAHTLITISFVIALGRILGKTKILGISFGATWVLFVGIMFSHYGLTIDADLLHFLNDFGLVLFVYSIGLQVGPGFFQSLRSGGLALNGLAAFVILISVFLAIGIHFLLDIPATTVTGIMSGAVTNIPGLGAAQQTYFDTTGNFASDIAQGCAITYPFGVIGCILTFILIRMWLYRIPDSEQLSTTRPITKKNESVEYKKPAGGFISRKILISRPQLNGISLKDLNLSDNLGATIVRINRSGIELSATPSTRLQYGDMVSVVGDKQSVKNVEKVLGNSLKRLDQPNLIPIFVGIALGCIIGSIPFTFPSIPQPVKLGLAGGPLIVSILITHIGPKFKVITYTTTSANLMIREIGISLFLACVGLETGNGFIDTLVHGSGIKWILCGAMITVIPMFAGGIMGKYALKLDWDTLTGVLSGSGTNPPALAYVSEQNIESDAAAVACATVYPLSMFLRVLVAQLLILLLVS